MQEYQTLLEKIKKGELPAFAGSFLLPAQMEEIRQILNERISKTQGYAAYLETNVKH